MHGVLTPKDLSRLQELFHGTDEDESGYIDEEEFCMLVKRLCKEDGIKPPSNKDLDKAFSDADADQSGNVDMDEFTSLYAKVKKGEVKGLGGGGIFLGGEPLISTRVSAAPTRLEPAKGLCVLRYARAPGSAPARSARRLTRVCECKRLGSSMPPCGTWFMGPWRLDRYHRGPPERIGRGPRGPRAQAPLLRAVEV